MLRFSDLHSLSEVLSRALPLNDLLVNLARGDVVVLPKLSIEEGLE